MFFSRLLQLVLIPIVIYSMSCHKESSPTTPTLEGIGLPVNVTLFSHNEDTWQIDTLVKYEGYRSNLVERLQLIHEFGATLNWQTDVTVLESMMHFKNETLATQTNGKNILHYLTEDMDFCIEPYT